MKSLVFDTGPVISIAMNHILGIIKLLKLDYKGDFVITESVRKELVDKPLETKEFMFEALQALRCINTGVLKVVDNNEIRSLGIRLESLANGIFMAHGQWIRIVHIAEMETLAAAITLGSDAVVVDERTTRLLVEKPMKLRNILKHKLHTSIAINHENLMEFSKQAKGIRCIRSVELILIAYERGMLNKYLPNLQDPKRLLLEAILWGIKLDGCSVSRKEIGKIISAELKR